MKTADYWVKHLELRPHPEGGFFKETYRSSERIEQTGLPNRFSNSKTFSTAIYFLLTSKGRSMFHRIKSDEIWHFHDGSPLTIFILSEDGYSEKKLGPNPENNESLQLVVPANTWFGALVIDENAFTLAGCTVSPGFDFDDFEIATAEYMLEKFPDQKEIILKLT